VWPRRAVVVDADPFGGDIAAGLGRGSWPAAAGLMELVVDIRTVPVETALRQRVHQPAAHCPLVLAGFGRPGQAAGVPWPEIAEGLVRIRDADFLIDCGRFVPADGVTPLVRRSDLVVVVTRSTLPAARSAARLIPLLQDLLQAEPGDARLSVLVVGGDRPYSAAEIAHCCAAPLLGEVPVDPRSAAVWSDGVPPGRGFARMPLQREARRVAEHLLRAAAGSPLPTGGVR
jgi:hypothetical protein